MRSIIPKYTGCLEHKQIHMDGNLKIIFQMQQTIQKCFTLTKSNVHECVSEGLEEIIQSLINSLSSIETYKIQNKYHCQSIFFSC